MKWPKKSIKGEVAIRWKKMVKKRPEIPAFLVFDQVLILLPVGSKNR